MINKKLVVLLIALLLVGCQSTMSQKRIELNTVQAIKISKEVNKEITKQEDIEIIANAINNGIEIEGILDVSPSNLVLEIIKKDGNSEIIWLWLENDDYNAMFMFADESSIGYNILKEDKTALLQLIFENQQ